jgi:hypothetical protein
MTLALAFAYRPTDDAPPEDRARVYVMADSRLTIDDGGNHIDCFIKAQTLGRRSAAIGAGHSTPFNVALEAARPFLPANEAHRQRQGLPPLSVWAEASLVHEHLDVVFSEYVTHFPDAAVSIVVAGFFSDGTPGLIHLIYPGGIVMVSRPRKGERLSIAIGSTEYAPILHEAARRSRPPQGKGYHDVASVLWDIMKHEGKHTRGVGGGIAVGYAESSHATFQWPPVKIESEVFFRGFRYVPELHHPKPLELDYDPTSHVWSESTQRSRFRRPWSRTFMGCHSVEASCLDILGFSKPAPRMTGC